MIIETENLYLREMNMDDFEALSAVISDEENMCHYVKPYDKEGVIRWINWCMDSYQKYGFGLWALCLKENDEMIGDCGLSMQNIDGQMLPEIGFHIRKDLHRKGYGKQAAEAVRDWAFEHTQFPALYSYCTADNVASYKTAEAIGMSFLKEFKDKDNITDRVSIITRQDWRKLYGK